MAETHEHDDKPVTITHNITAARYFLLHISFQDHTDSPNTFSVELGEDLTQAAKDLWSFLSSLTEEARTGVLYAWLEGLERQMQMAKAASDKKGT